MLAVGTWTQAITDPVLHPSGRWLHQPVGTADPAAPQKDIPGLPPRGLVDAGVIPSALQARDAYRLLALPLGNIKRIKLSRSRWEDGMAKALWTGHTVARMPRFSRCPNLAVTERAPLLRLVGSVGLTVIAAAAVIMASPTNVAAQEAISLFNRNDLTGWTIHGTERWYVENGELVGESGPDAAYGYLATEATFKDFELTLEFLQEADGNSGVFIRSHVEGTRVSGWQVEVAPPGRHTGGVYESYGRGWLIEPELGRETALRMGEWNAMHIRVIGDRVTTWLNGVEMVDLVDERIGKAEGHIALQIHDGGGIKVRWRNLRVLVR